jgi:hypothetical protein
MTTVKISQSTIDEMLATAAESYGYTFDELRDMAVTGTLNEPELRDLWLIWADEPLALSTLG